MATDKTRVLLDTLESLSGKLDANLVLLISDHADFIEETRKRVQTPIVLATSDFTIRDEFEDRVRTVIQMSEALSGSVGVLTQVKELLLTGFLNGTLQLEDRVLCVMSNVDAVDLLCFFDVERDVELTHLREEMKDRVDMRVVERILRLASELIREGREGRTIGTLFVLGDTEAVLEQSRQAVINPFQGHPPQDRNILDERVWETAKEFAQVDGAFIIRSNGLIESAGRYVDTHRDIELPSGLGGRHLAAASITKVTKSVAIVASASGNIRIFKDGRVVMMIGKI